MKPTELQIGQIVTFNYGAGMGSEDGEVISTGEDRWGGYAEIRKADNMQIERISSNSTEVGIGWQLKGWIEQVQVKIIRGRNGRRKAGYKNRQLPNLLTGEPGEWFTTWHTMTVADATSALRAGRYNLHGSIVQVVKAEGSL